MDRVFGDVSSEAEERRKGRIMKRIVEGDGGTRRDVA